MSVVPIGCSATAEVELGSPQPLLISARGVAELIGCCERTVARLEADGLLPKRRQLGGLVRWSRSEIEAWVENGCHPVIG